MSAQPGPVDEHTHHMVRYMVDWMMGKYDAVPQTSIYVMWSERKGLSKIGIAYSPPSRASQLRREKRDDTIRLITCWNIVELGSFVGSREVEACIHMALYDAGLHDPGNTFASEWFDVPWPAAVEFVEQFALLLAPWGLRLARMPGNHGK